jgi:hypothetical protein
MGDRTTFSDAEWQELQWALMLAGSHVTSSDYPGLINSFKEAAGGSRFLAMCRDDDNALVAALARDQARKSPKDVKGRADVAGEPGLAHIRAATAIVAEKAPEDLAAFRDVLVALATIVAGEVDGTSPAESEAVARVRAAVGAAEPAP